MRNSQTKVFNAFGGALQPFVQVGLQSNHRAALSPHTPNREERNANAPKPRGALQFAAKGSGGEKQRHRSIGTQRNA